MGIDSKCLIEAGCMPESIRVCIGDMLSITVGISQDASTFITITSKCNENEIDFHVDAKSLIIHDTGIFHELRERLYYNKGSEVDTDGDSLGTINGDLASFAERHIEAFNITKVSTEESCGLDVVIPYAISIDNVRYLLGLFGANLDDAPEEFIECINKEFTCNIAKTKEINERIVELCNKMNS